MGFTPPNLGFRGNNRGTSNDPPNGPGASSAPRGGSNNGNRFDVDSLMARAQNPEVIAPGQGAIPVEPFGPSGTPRQATGLPCADMRDANTR